MIISKARVQATAQYGVDKSKGEKKVPELEDLLTRRDYVGAITLLMFRRHGNKGDVKLLEWLAYCHFHFGEHDKALKIYKELLAADDPDPLYFTYSAACYYYMGLYAEAEQQAHQGPRCGLQARILFHCAHKQGDEAKLMQYHQSLGDAVEDRLSLASVHYQRSHFQEATDEYKRVLLEQREFLALNAYVALCYARLDYYDVSQEILQAYLSAVPDSAVAVNLKACNTFKLQNGKAAEGELRGLAELTGGKHTEHELIRHNLVVFRGGEGAVQALAPLGDSPPEARLNLVIHHLRRGDLGEAYSLVKDMEPSAPQEYILKAVVHALLGQQAGGDPQNEHIKQAQQYFQLVGASASECDTIPGRQAMASCFFLLKQFEDVLIFLNSIRTYFPTDDTFNWNYGLAKASTGAYKEAEEALLAVQSEQYKNDYIYLSCLARCYILNGAASLAWELYQGLESGQESYNLLLLIANDCYRMGAFYFAAKAFDVLERLDPNPEYSEGKKGACMGCFQMVVAGKEEPDLLEEVVAMLRSGGSNGSGGRDSSQVAVRAILQWAQSNGVDIQM